MENVTSSCFKLKRVGLRIIGVDAEVFVWLEALLAAKLHAILSQCGSLSSFAILANVADRLATSRLGCDLE